MRTASSRAAPQVTQQGGGSEPMPGRGSDVRHDLGAEPPGTACSSSGEPLFSASRPAESVAQAPRSPQQVMDDTQGTDIVVSGIDYNSVHRQDLPSVARRQSAR